MRFIFATILLSVTLSPPFIEAQARAVEVTSDGMRVEVEVEVDSSALVVLVRGLGAVDELPPVALTEIDAGRWVGIVDVPVVADIRIGFELIRPGGGSAVVSALHTLSDLGVDPAVFAVDLGDVPSTTAAPVDDGVTGPSLTPIWLAVAAGAAALALLLVWWLGGNGDGDGDEDADDTVASDLR